MKLGYSQDWSRSGYLSKVSSRDSLWVFYILSYIFHSDRCLVFKILNYRYSSFMLSIIGVFYIFSILAHSRSDIKYAIQQKFYYKAVLSDQDYSTSFERFIQQTVQQISIFWLLFNRLEGPTCSNSYLNWYNFRPCPLCVHFTSYRNCEDAIFL